MGGPGDLRGAFEKLQGSSNPADYAIRRPVSSQDKKDDAPGWAKAAGLRPLKGQSGKDYAKNVMDAKYGKVKHNTGPGSDFNKLKKYADTHFIKEKPKGSKK